MSMAADPIKARLLEAAGEEFARKGFDSATVRAICERAGANVAAVNYHFGDKEQLYAQAVVEAHRCTNGAPSGDDDFDLGATPAEGLRAFVRHFLEHVLFMSRLGTWHGTLMLRELLQPTSACEVLVRGTIRPKFERLRALMALACPGADDRALNALAFSVVGQCLYYRTGRTVAERLVGVEAYEALDADYLTDHITRFCLAALGLAPPFGPGPGLPRPAGAEARGPSNGKG